MVDTLSVARRSENMRRIRSKGTQPEMVVRHMVHAMGFRFRLHSPNLPGKPDLVFPNLKKIIEVRGCFWHQHKGCIDSHVPKSKVGYWRPKLRRNVYRDKQNLNKLNILGWRVLVFWECEVKTKKAARLDARIKKFLKTF
jgi:DNA mismatch endonuclease (patch repair protein)